MGEYVARRGSARLPIRARVVVKYPGVDEVFEEITENLGMAGMFVCGDSPMPPGTLMHFELRPAENWKVLKGRGRIVWVQQHSTSRQPAGMGVRFIELEERARRGIRWLIETHQEDETRPFDSWTVPEQFARSRPGELHPDALATQEIPPLEPEERRRAYLPIAAGVAGLALVGWLGWTLLRPGSPQLTQAEPEAAVAEVSEAEPEQARPQSSETVDETSGGQLETAVPVTSAEDSTGPAPEPPAAESSADGAPSPSDDGISEALSRRVDAWAAAWASQDVDRYLSFYASDFRPTDGSSRAAWASQRRQRLERPSFIRIDVEDTQVLDGSSARPSTVFTQSYTSNTFSDKVTKSLTWKRVDGRWLIVAERAAS